MKTNLAVCCAISTESSDNKSKITSRQLEKNQGLQQTNKNWLELQLSKFKVRIYGLTALRILL